MTRGTATPLDTVQAAPFLHALFDGGDGVVEVRHLPSTARAFVPCGDIGGTLAALQSDENVYVGCATRRDATSGALAPLIVVK